MTKPTICALLRAAGEINERNGRPATLADLRRRVPAPALVLSGLHDDAIARGYLLADEEAPGHWLSESGWAEAEKGAPPPVDRRVGFRGVAS